METFNENLILNLFEININDYFEKFYSKFFIDVNTKFMKFLLDSDYNNTDFYIDQNILKEFNLVTTTKSNDILKLIKSIDLIKNIDYTSKQKKFTTGTKSGLFYNEYEYKFTLNSFKLCFILGKNSTPLVNNNIKEWICYEKCYRYYTDYLKSKTLHFNKYMEIPNDILNSNKQLQNKIIELKENIDLLQDNIANLNNKADNLKVEFKDGMNMNIIDIKNYIKDIIKY